MNWIYFGGISPGLYSGTGIIWDLGYSGFSNSNRSFSMLLMFSSIDTVKFEPKTLSVAFPTMTGVMLSAVPTSSVVTL